MSEIDVIVLFGASGDLARKMLFPALYRLEERGALDQRIVGVALDDWDTPEFAREISHALADSIDGVDSAVEQRLLQRAAYVSGDYADRSTFDRLSAACGSDRRALHYLAIPPELFETVVSSLGRAGLLSGSRILIEKPFGQDLSTCRQLNRILHEEIDESSIYRIDHFLGKEPVENLLAFRYANPIFDAVWSRHYVDHIQLTMAEAFGVEDRGAVYESLGVVRDVVQNHLLQVVCLLTMEAPVDPGADAFADERAKVLRAMKSVQPEHVVYGQYEGYRNSPNVADDSAVPTFAALSLFVDTPRWSGVPIYLRTGKAMATTSTEAVVVFRESPPLRFSTVVGSPEANRLVFRIGPEDGVVLMIQTKKPGEGFSLVTTPLTVDYENVFGRIPLGHEHVLFDALEGNRSQFAREDGVEQAWRVVGRICDPAHQPSVYEVGSWGPEAAAGILGPGRNWIDPTNRQTP